VRRRDEAVLNDTIGGAGPGLDRSDLDPALTALYYTRVF
jgi:hypothetical protein